MKLRLIALFSVFCVFGGLSASDLLNRFAASVGSHISAPGAAAGANEYLAMANLTVGALNGARLISKDRNIDLVSAIGVVGVNVVGTSLACGGVAGGVAAIINSDSGMASVLAGAGAGALTAVAHTGCAFAVGMIVSFACIALSESTGYVDDPLLVRSSKRKSLN